MYAIALLWLLTCWFSVQFEPASGVTIFGHLKGIVLWPSMNELASGTSSNLR
jgi:hypothetical protein